MQWQSGNASNDTSPDFLRAAVAQAIALAQQLDRSAILSYAQPCPSVDPLSLLAAVYTAGQYRFYWEQSDANLTIAAAGTIAGVSECPEGSDRFAVAKNFARKCFERLVVACHPDLAPEWGGLHILGGFSFYETAPKGSDRYDFPSLLWCVPRWLLRRVDHTCVLTINHVVQPDDNVAAVVSELSDTLTCLEARHAPLSLFPIADDLQVHEVTGTSSWTEIVERAIAAIENGNLDKVVLARALEVKAQKAFNPLQVLHALRREYPQCIAFLLDCGLGETFLGATPEHVLQFHTTADGLELHSDALAGSIQRGSSPEGDRELGDRLLHSRKDEIEHQIVIRSICDCFQKAGAIIDDLPSMQLLKLSNVQHLYTPITARLPQADALQAFDVLRQLHPTAAVGGAPRDKAISLMQQWEACDRGWYAAPIGWLDSNGRGAFAVGIRSGYIRGDRARIFAGAGIVADSQAIGEQNETTIKFAALLKALGAI
jgi:menaquinone-specific isochorismate synthase